MQSRCSGCSWSLTTLLLSFSPFQSFGKVPFTPSKESIFRQNQSCIDRSNHRKVQSQTKGKQHLDAFLTTYYLINSIITSDFCRHENSVIPKLTNFNSTLLTTSDSERNSLPVHSLFKEALKWTKPKLPLFKQVYSLNIKQIWTSNQTEVIYPLLIFFLKNLLWVSGFVRFLVCFLLWLFSLIFSRETLFLVN